MRKLYLMLGLGLFASSVIAQSSFTENIIKTRSDRGPAMTNSTRSMTASITSTNGYIAGSTMDLTFVLDMTTPDLEYGDSLSITFNNGLTINTASNPFTTATEGQGDEFLNLPIVSPTVTWGDNDNNYGGIEPGTHTFYVNVTIPAGVTGPITATWHLDGDEYGAAPNFTTGVTTINSLPSVPNLSISGGSDNKYYSTPLVFVTPITFNGEVYNNGDTLNTATNATVSITSTSYTESTALTLPLDPFASEAISWSNPATLSAAGNYEVIFDVPVSNDFDPSDNMDTIDIMISDSMYAYVDTVNEGSVGFNDGTEGVFGSIFDIPVTKDLTSVSFYVPDPDPTTVISVVVYEVNANGPTNTILYQSPGMTHTASGPTVINQPANYTLTGGNRYLIGLHKQATGALMAATNSSGYFPDTHYAFFNGGWNEVGGLGFPAASAVFANFGLSCHADFDHNFNPNNYLEVDFTSTSLYEGSGTLTYAYDFGDGTGTANTEDASYTYAAEGTYNVCLTIDDNGTCNSTTCHDVVADDGITGITDAQAVDFELYPNPSNGIFTINYSKPAVITIINIAGTVVYSGNITLTESQINLNELSEGSYLLKLESEDGVSIKRISIIK